MKEQRLPNEFSLKHSLPNEYPPEYLTLYLYDKLMSCRTYDRFSTLSRNINKTNVKELKYLRC